MYYGTTIAECKDDEMRMIVMPARAPRLTTIVPSNILRLLRFPGVYFISSSSYRLPSSCCLYIMLSSRNILSSRLSFLGRRCRGVLPFRAAMRPSSSSSSSSLGDLEHHELGSRSSSSDSKISSGSSSGKPLFPEALWNERRMSTLPEHERNAEAAWL